MIADYVELIAEVVERSGDTGLPNRAKMLVGFLENHLNKELRVGEMEVSATLTTDAVGDVALPADYNQMRTVFVSGCEIPRVSLSQLTGDRSWGRHGARYGHAVSGNNLVTAVSDTAVDIVYYAAIPSLADNGTNWLLDLDPEIYIVGLLWQVSRARSDYEAASVQGNELSRMIDALLSLDSRKRLISTKIQVKGPTP